MHPARPSATAARTATDRAQHQLLDSPPLFVDPFAGPLIGSDAVVPLGSPAPPFRAPVRAFLAARAVFTEEHLARAYAAGTRHAVILGAGLDTFALRNPFPDLTVLEVDHPDTQAWKRDRLSAAGLALPPTARLVPVDFTRDDLALALRTAGLPDGAPTFFSWLGVTYYLPSVALSATLTTLASRGSGTTLACDFFPPLASLPPEAQRGFGYFLEHVASLGEPIHSLFTPDAFAERLRAHGLTPREILGPAELTVRYFSARTDGLRPIPHGHLALARVD